MKFIAVLNNPTLEIEAKARRQREGRDTIIVQMGIKAHTLQKESLREKSCILSPLHIWPIEMGVLAGSSASKSNKNVCTLPHNSDASDAGKMRGGVSDAV